MRLKVRFDYEDLKDFVNAISTFPCDVDAIKGRYIIDCKSIMGLLSIDFSQGFDIQLHSVLEDEVMLNFIQEKIGKYIVK